MKKLLEFLKELIFIKQAGELFFEDTWEHEIFWATHDYQIIKINLYALNSK